jgi:penicillin amidase
MYRVNRARNWPEFLAGLELHQAPSLNFVYADSAGNIGYTLAGKIPKRPNAPTLLPVDGWDETSDWQGFIPFDELPRLFNPPSGVIATANNRIADDAYPYYLAHFFEPPHRVRRIHDRLNAQAKLTRTDMKNIQLDDFSLHALELIEALRDDLTGCAENEPAVARAATELLRWDGRCTSDSVGAALFHLLHHHLLRDLLTPALGPEIFSAYVEILNQCLVPTDAILKNPASPWFAQRSRWQLVASALRLTCAELAAALGADPGRWQWGKFHHLQINHALGRVSLLKPILSVGPHPAAGSGATINIAFYRHSNPFAQVVGPSLRMIVELGPRPDSSAVLNPGQSGHFTSAHYDDQSSPWRSGHQYELSHRSNLSDPDRCLLLKPC